MFISTVLDTCSRQHTKLIVAFLQTVLIIIWQNHKIYAPKCSSIVYLNYVFPVDKQSFEIRNAAQIER